MPSEDYLQSIIYNMLSNYLSDYDYYYCGYPKTYYYQYGATSDTWKQEDTLICYFSKTSSISLSSSSTPISKSPALVFSKHTLPIYSFNTVQYTIDVSLPLYGNMLIDNSGFAKEVMQKDLLINTDFYELKKLDDLKSSLVSSGNNSSSSIDITYTNYILFSILLAICILICFLVFRKLFFRGV